MWSHKGRWIPFTPRTSVDALRQRVVGQCGTLEALAAGIVPVLGVSTRPDLEFSTRSSYYQPIFMDSRLYAVLQYRRFHD